jgi:hypothetical protein
VVDRSPILQLMGPQAWCKVKVDHVEETTTYFYVQSIIVGSPRPYHGYEISLGISYEWHYDCLPQSLVLR